MPAKAEAAAPFPEYFEAEDKGSEWHLTCKRCKKRFALVKTSDHPGNMLALLNHAHSHKPAE